MKMVSSEKAVAIGEIGLDYYYDNSPRDVQRKVFEAQLQIAKDLDVPVVIHSRDAPNQSSAETDSGSGQAIDDLKKIIDEVDYERIVIHCCTEKWEDVSDLVGRGFILGFTGIATYAKSEHIRNVIKNCPLEQMMIETDSPYLAPEAQRGKRNEPAFVVEVAKLIAEIKGVEYEEVDRVTEKSTMDFYNIN
jgi:TatD DNase family protein